MSDSICFNKTFFAIFVVLIIGIAYSLYMTKKIYDSKPQKCLPQECIIPQSDVKSDQESNITSSSPKETKSVNIKAKTVNITSPKPNVVHDVVHDVHNVHDIRVIDPVHETAMKIKEYDYNKLNDPLSYPSRRVSSHSIPPWYLKRMIDIPTRGQSDGPILLGLLKGTKGKNPIRLFGRETFHQSGQYEYYTSVSEDHDSIKIPIKTKNKKELYDDDEVVIGELDDTFKVQLYDYDFPRYCPDIL